MALLRLRPFRRWSIIVGAIEFLRLQGFCLIIDFPLRLKRFVTQKIVATAKNIAAGCSKKLLFGNI